MDEAQGNKSRAAELVGLPSYQALTNWLAKYDVKIDRPAGRPAGTKSESTKSER
jgi:hypothetical protein